jgi:phosphoglycerol transferase MdoB-like AlkP superfamily enzyme
MYRFVVPYLEFISGANTVRIIDKAVNLTLNPVAAALATAISVAFLYLLEGAIAHMPFVVLSTFGIAAILFVLSRRIYFSLYSALGLTSLLSVASVIKYRNKGFDLHIYDFVFTGTDASAFTFLLEEFAALILPLLAIMLGAMAMLAIVFSREPVSRMLSRWRLAFATLVIGLIPATYPLKADEPRYFHYLGGFNASAFFVSLLDLKDAALGQDITDRFARRPAADPFTASGPCSTETPKPDIFIVLSESQVDLSEIDRYGIKQRFSDGFRSADGKRRNLRVETFGGGTWISNFSLMTGLSSLEFGWQAPYLTTVLEGKIRNSLATELARCGYRTAVLMPMRHNFVNEGPFLKSIGFDEVLDYDRIGASQYAHHDRFYFEAARAFIAEHRKSDGRPLFLQVQTMFAHSPYSTQMTSSPLGPDTGSGDSELDEYVRRVAQSQTDFNWFLNQSALERESHPAIILEFGDHQSIATKDLIARDHPDFAIDDLGSSAYKTYYTVHGFGARINMRPFDFPALDIGYLGVSLLEAAGLASSPMFADLSALRDHCGGKLYFCPDRKSVDKHLSRRIASGYLTIE